MPKLFLDRYYIYPDGTIATLDGRIMSQYDNNSRNVAWYKRIKLIGTDGSRKAYYVHRLVAAMFIGDVTGYDVDHIDGDTKNNHVSNLRIVSHGDNMRAMMVRVQYGKNFKRVRYV